MLKKKKALAVCAVFATVSVLSVAALGSVNHHVLPLFGHGLRSGYSGEGGYTLVIDSSNRLSGGNVQTPGGTNIHFDEYGVDENVGGGLLELAAYGNIALQTYISGIEKVEVTSETGEGKSYFLTVGASPNSSEYVTQGYDGYSSLDLI